MDKENNIKEIVASFAPQDYVEVLPASSREAAKTALENEVDLFLFAQDLAIQPGQGLVTKGGSLWAIDMFPRITNELFLLLCTNDATYDAWREKLSSEGAKTARAVVLVSSTAIAATIGVVPALILPFVAIIFAAIAKMTIQAWCKSQFERKALEDQQRKAIEENK